MRLWVDAQLPPGICSWLEDEFGIEAVAVRELGLRDASDTDIFTAPEKPMSPFSRKTRTS